LVLDGNRRWPNQFSVHDRLFMHHVHFLK